MNIKTIPYKTHQESVPASGRHIIAQQRHDEILVYQAYNHNIADFALANQYFGGNHYSYSRMSWIKPNFLWMMYRCGWGEKENQERVLGMWIKKTDFDLILSESVFSSYQADIYKNHEQWKSALVQKPARLQWDPDHDAYGGKQERKAIQLGIKNNLLENFGKEMIIEIIDFTPFVKTQKSKIDEHKLDELMVPEEWVYTPSSEDVRFNIGLK